MNLSLNTSKTFVNTGDIAYLEGFSKTLGNVVGASEDGFGAFEDRFGASEDRFESSEDRFRTFEDRFESSEDRFRTFEDRFRSLKNIKILNFYYLLYKKCYF